MNDKLSDLFNVTTVEDDYARDANIIEHAPPENTKKVDPKQEEDFKLSRDNITDLIDQGSRALESLIEVAEQSQHPRAYEVVATLVNTLVNANKDLMEIHKKKQLLEKNNGQISEYGPKTVNNNMFVGSTADLQKLIKEIKEDEER